MRLQLIRNATMKLSFAGRTILTDPLLSPRFGFEAWANGPANPIVELPLPVEEVLSGVELVLVSHLHKDHFDPAAQGPIDPTMPLLCQPGDGRTLRDKGFQAARSFQGQEEWGGIILERTDGRHGRDHWLERMGRVSGFVLKAEGEPIVYWAGDTVWCPAVAEAVGAHRPEVIITHSGGARLEGGEPIIMDQEDTLEVCRAAPWARVVAVHLEALDHCPVTRASLRALASDQGIGPKRLLIPEDGEVLDLSSQDPAD